MIFLITFFSSNFIVISSRFGTTSLLPRPNSLFPRPPPSPAPRSTQDVQEPQPRQKWQIRPTLEGDEERPPRTRVTVRPPAAGRARVRCSKDLQRRWYSAFQATDVPLQNQRRPKARRTVTPHQETRRRQPREVRAGHPPARDSGGRQVRGALYNTINQPENSCCSSSVLSSSSSSGDGPSEKL